MVAFSLGVFAALVGDCCCAFRCMDFDVGARLVVAIRVPAERHVKDGKADDVSQGNVPAVAQPVTD